MADLTLDSESWDIVFEDGDLTLVDGVNEVSQNSRFRLMILRGEVFEDNRIGVPWITDMVDTRVSIDAKKQIIRSTILSVPDVLTLDKLEIQVDDSSGVAEAEFSGTSVPGEFGVTVTL